MCYIRDGLDRYNLSFSPAGFNIADCGAKLKGLAILADLAFLKNRCRIGFLPRTEMILLKKTLDLGATDPEHFSSR